MLLVRDSNTLQDSMLWSYRYKAKHHEKHFLETIIEIIITKSPLINDRVLSVELTS